MAIVQLPTLIGFITFISLILGIFLFRFFILYLITSIISCLEYYIVINSVPKMYSYCFYILIIDISLIILDVINLSIILLFGFFYNISQIMFLKFFILFLTYSLNLLALNILLLCSTLCSLSLTLNSMFLLLFIIIIYQIIASSIKNNHISAIAEQLAFYLISIISNSY